MRSTLTILVAASLALSGCGVARRAAEEKDRKAGFDAALATCNTTKFRTRLEAAQCIGAAEETYQAPGSEVADLMRVKIATRNSIAAKLDAGKITQAEADLETAKATSDLVGEAKRRFNQDRTVRAQQDIADAASRPARPLNCVGGPAVATCF